MATHGLFPGAIVHFVPGESQAEFMRQGVPIVGIIVRDWGGSVNLRLLLDGCNSMTGQYNYRDHEWQTSVPHDPTGQSGYSWHFPDEV